MHTQVSLHLPVPAAPSHVASRSTSSPSPDHSESSVVSPRKPKYRVLNDLERKGNRAEQDKYAERFRKRGDFKDKVEYMKAQRQEIESCFQVMRDELDRTKEEAAKKQQALDSKDQEIAGLKRKFEQTAKEKDKEHGDVKILLGKYRGEQAAHSIEKKARLDEAATARLQLEEHDVTHRNELEAARAIFQSTIQEKEEKFRSEMEAMRQELQTVKDEHASLQSMYQKCITEWNDFREHYNTLSQLKTSLETQLGETRSDNEQLRRQLGQVQEALAQVRAAGAEKSRLSIDSILPSPITHVCSMGLRR